MSALLELEGVDVIFRRGSTRFQALHQVDLAIRAGERLGIVGGSGSGKTTILRTLLGLIRPAAGEVRCDGRRIDGLPDRELADIRSRVSLVSQDPNASLNPRMKLRDIVAEPLRSPWRRTRTATDRDHAVTEAVTAVGLEAAMLGRYPHELSGGQRQRVAIARAVVRQPKILIADEPTGNLDPKHSWDIVRLLEKINKYGTTVLLTTHNVDIVNKLKRRVITIDHGKITSDQARGTYKQ